MRIRLICNPGSGSAPDVRGTEDRLRELGAEVVQDDALADRIVVVGGDGTIAPAAELASTLGVPLGVVGAGTANDFVRAHELPEDVDDGLRLAATGTATRLLELAFMGDRPFVNVASAGLSPAAAERAEPLKKALGPLAYSAGGALAGAQEDPVALAARVDGEPVFDGDAWQLSVASSGAFGGGAAIEDADPGDGRLDLVVVPGGSRAALPKVAIAMRRGTIARLDDVLHTRGRTIEADVPDGTAFNLDGEVIETGGTVRFTVRGGAFALIVPS
jgi:diacylglycerol kinase (ATP)